MLELEFDGVRVVCTDRHGGVSAAPFDSLNLGDVTGDDRDAVAENRRRVADRIGGSAADAGAWAWIHQWHGATVATFPAQPRPSAPNADASVTALVGVPLVVVTADCAPLALFCESAVAAVHAGWKGLVAGVIEAAVGALARCAAGEAGPSTVRAVLGPCVGPAHYEFGPADLDRVAARFGPGVRATTASGAPALDLRAGARAALARAGVTDLVDLDVCTASSPDHFSHRRDGRTGRQALVVVREP